MMWFALCLLALGDPLEPQTPGPGVDALGEYGQQLYAQARAFEAGGAYEDALRRYRWILQLDPEFRQAFVDVGRVLEALGRSDEALQAYARLPGDADAVEALGRLQLERGDRAAAMASFRLLRDLRPAWPGWRVLMADALGPLDPDRAASLLLEYLDFVNTSLEDEGMAEVTERVAVALRASRDPAEPLVGGTSPAVGLLERLIARYQGQPSADDAVERLTRLLVAFEIDQTAAELARAGNQPLPPEDVARLRRAREAYAEGDYVQAAQQLGALVQDQPRSAVAWAALSDARAAQGDLAGAEQAMRAAQHLEPLEAAYLARLGELLTEAYGPRFDGEAANALARAVRRSGNDAELWLRKARAERRAGSWELAVASYRRALELNSTASWAKEAEQAIEGAARPRPADVALPDAPGPPESVPLEAWQSFHRAWAWRERGDPEEALAALQVARSSAPQYVRAINLEAAIRADLDELDVARDLYRTSLDIDAAQPSVVAVLAELEEQAGEDAGPLWERAAELGDPGALWREACRQRERGQWWAARRTLDDYFARTTRDPHYAAALELDAELSRTIQLVVGFGGLVGLAVVSFPLWRVLRQRLGVGLEVLLERAPREWRDVARICSAIRHEVLKHHTSVLESIADAVDAGDPEPAQWAVDRLFGPGGALELLDDYVAELTAIGRRAGVELNLRHVDPTFSPLLAAVERLRALEGDLAVGEGRRLSASLRELSEQLNGEAYGALGRLVAGLSVLDVEPLLVRSVWQQIGEEPAFLGQVLPDFVVADAHPARAVPLTVRIYPSDFRDIVGNLLRNAVELSLESGQGRIKVELDLEEDPITGLERVLVRVLDTVPYRLTTSMIRGRYISRGLGLAVDLTSRAGGSIHVEEVDGWEKALVVRLPRAEAEDRLGRFG